jgi:chemotaxis protein CheX
MYQNLNYLQAVIGVIIMSDCDNTLKSSVAEAFLSTASIEYVDASVREVFSMMYGFEIEAIQIPDTDQSLCGLDERTAIVGFSGMMRGSFQVRISSMAARSIASAMLGGVPVEENGNSIDDTMGELCNMIAGGWKNGIPIFSECTLSPPTVISGRDYKIHIYKPSVELWRIYKFDGHTLHLTLHCESKGPPDE